MSRSLNYSRAQGITIKKSVCKPLEEGKLIVSNRHGFVENKLCQNQLISFDKVTGWMKGIQLTRVHLDLSKTFDEVPRGCPISELVEHGLDQIAPRRIDTWLYIIRSIRNKT